jgi:signal transduction histidine kinase
LSRPPDPAETASPAGARSREPLPPAGEEEQLVDRVLRLAHSEVHRVEFLGQLCRMLAEQTGSRAVQLWMLENGSCARCACTADDGERFELRLEPCPYRAAAASAVHCGQVGCEAGRLLDRAGPGERVLPGRVDELPAGLLQGGLPRGVAGFVMLRLAISTETVGWLVLLGRAPDGWDEAELAGLDGLATACAVALLGQRAQAALRERVKELTGLYGLSQLAVRPGISEDELLQGAARLLPPAWQYPEIAVGTVCLDDRVYRSGPEPAVVHGRQTADIVICDEVRGSVEVAYTEPRAQLDEGPFLAEERSLLDAIAVKIGTVMERRLAAAEGERLREQLRHADRLATIGQLAAGLAHELNEPLGAALGFAQLARKHPDLPAQVDEDIRKIEVAALHAREIIRKLMLFARQAPPQKRSVDLNGLVRETLSFFTARCASRRIEVECRLAPDLPPVVADVAQVQQIIVNLAVNAIQAMPEQGRLTLETEAADGQVVLRVRDTGEGIPEELQPRIFLPFFTTKDVHEGTGLGLSVVHGIVHAHGGTIGVTSEQGLGSCFEVSIPRNGAGAPEAEPVGLEQTHGTSAPRGAGEPGERQRG